MPATKSPTLTQRNLIWTAVIILVGLAAGFAFGLVWGLVAAAGVLVISEIVERGARRKRTRLPAGDQ